MSFRVDLDTYRGPLDLLLYLVRKHEVDVSDIAIALIATQYIDYLSTQPDVDVDDVGEFIEIASSLLEIKSQWLLPRGGEEVETLEDPRHELVHRLLEYKRYKDAASLLDEQSQAWQQRYSRQANDAPPRQTDLESQPIHEVELWDLVSAFGRIMRENLATQPSSIVYDETPIQVYMQQIHQKLVCDRQVMLSDMFVPGMHKSAMIGVFLAILELVRHHCVRTEQNELHGEIMIVPGESFDEQLDASCVGNDGGIRPQEDALSHKPR